MCKRLVFLVCFAAVWSSSVHAEVTRVEILHREPFADGREFGAVGAYEKLTGWVHFAADPAAAANRSIIDLSLAPRNPRGRVEWSATFYMLKPVDLSRGNHALFYDVNNRGGPTALRMFNDSASVDPDNPGNGYFMRNGFTVLWSGWIGQVVPGSGRMQLKVPQARDGDDRPLRGLVRAEIVSDAAAETRNIAQWANQGYYPPTERGERTATLTWRQREADPRVPIPRSQFAFVVTQPPDALLPLVELRVSGGFRPGYIYELVYEAQGSIVQGLGLAGIRDLVSHLRYSSAESNPLRRPDGSPAIEFAYGFGTSQSGRCLRQLLYDGFNADESGRRVFDALMPHVAGGGLGFFNHRFASPTRHNAQHDNHQYPADVFPFAYVDATDPATGRTDSIMRRARDSSTVPKVMQTQSAAEYWHRAASLVHTDPLGKQDLPLGDDVRLYVFGGCQHGPGSDPPRLGSGQLLSNPADYRPFLRALLTTLDAWVRRGVEPPASVYPRIADGSLVGWDQPSSGFPALPGVRYPEVIQSPSFWDYGPDFLSRRIMTQQPPKRGIDYVVKVPRCDRDGNELSVLRLPRLSVPVGTYTGWALRNREIGADTELLSLTGSFIPFPKTVSEREAAGDPRASIAERYGSFDEFRARYFDAARTLAKQRLWLDEDVDRLETSVEQFRGYFADMPLSRAERGGSSASNP